MPVMHFLPYLIEDKPLDSKEKMIKKDSIDNEEEGKII